MNMSSHSILLPHGGKTPSLGKDVFIAPHTTLIGDLEIGDSSSVWFGSVIRADVNYIRIGKESNVQDLSMLHVSYKKAPLIIGNRVTIGHRCVLHACTIEDEVLIGMGAIVMDQAVIGKHSIVGAGALVTEGVKIPPASLVLGSPAKVIRTLKPEEIEFIQKSAHHYKILAGSYLGTHPWPTETGFR